METYAFVQDLPVPVSRGSYRYKTGTVSPTLQHKGFRVIYIKSGVKTPLLSDLEAKVPKLRYGLDVVQRHQMPSKTPNTWIRESPEITQSVPPPTANTNARRATADTSNNRQCIYMGKAKTNVDFNKLHPYKWNSTYDQEKLPPVAPDPLYRNTYINKEILELRTPSPQFKLRRGLALYDNKDIEKIRPHTVHTSHPSQSMDKENRQLTRPTTKQSGRARSSLKTAMARPETNNLELDIRSFDQREKLMGPNGCLHAQVKHSIKFIKKVERGDLIEIPHLARPMNSEKGKYRPHSRTVIPKSPPPAVAEESENNDTTKDPKSAEVYVNYVKKNQMAKMMNNEVYNATPGMKEILARYITPGAFTDTPRTPALDRCGTTNPPASRCSTRLTSKLTIPEWAEEEKQTVEEQQLTNNNTDTASTPQLSVNLPSITPTTETVTKIPRRESPAVTFSQDVTEV